MKAHKVKIERKGGYIYDVIESAISVVEFRAIYKNIQINYRMSEDVPDSILMDKHRVQQVLVNLLNNAIKFSEGGDVWINVTTAWSDEDISLSANSIDTSSHSSLSDL